MLEKDYYIKDIAIAKDSALIYEYLPDGDHLVKTKENWKNLNKLIKYADDEVDEFLEDVKTIRNNLS